MVDTAKVLTGSANFTHSGLHGDPDGGGGYNGDGNINSIVTIVSSDLAAIYTTQFGIMWGDGPGGQTNSLFGLGKPDHAMQTVYTDNDNIRVDVQFSPQSPSLIAGSTLENIDNHLATASTRIHTAQFVFSAQMLADTMQARHSVGVDIQGVGDSAFFNRYYSEFLDIIDTQVPDGNGNYEVDSVTGDPNNPWTTPAEAYVAETSSYDKFHHKYWIVDNTVIIGSQNASAAGAFDNDENLLIIYDQAVAEQFEGEFSRRFCEAKGALNCDGTLTHESGIFEGIAFTAQEATAVMAFVAVASLQELDVDVTLDSRAANAIYNDRPTTMADLAATYYVGPSALTKLRDYAMLPAPAATYEVQFNLGNTTTLTALYSYPNSTNGMTLRDTLEHYLNQRIERDGIPLGSAVVDISGGVYEAIIRGDTADIFEYETDFASFYSAGNLAVTAVDDLINNSLWNSAEWSFFLPLGLSLINQRSVQLLHFPPDYSLTEQDYLNSSTSQRWETLLKLNNVPESELTLYESILDIAPIAAPASEGSSLDPTYTYFEPYVVAMLSLLLQADEAITQALPMVAHGGPVRTWLSGYYNLQGFGVNVVDSIEITTGVFTPVIGANHPSYIWYAKDVSYQLALDVMEEDLISACWQESMGNTPTQSATTAMQTCTSYWQSQPETVCVQTEIQAYGKTLAAATAACQAH